MTAFTREEARILSDGRKGPHVTILMPLHPVAAEFQQDVIRLKNMLRAAKDDLTQDGLRGAEVDDILAPATRLLDTMMFWKQSGSGLAIFLANGFSRVYRVPLELEEFSLVSKEFHLKPLLQLLHGDGTYFVLALSANEVRLLQCTRHDVNRVAIPDAPANKAEVSKYRVNTPTLQGHTGKGRSGGHLGSLGRGESVIQHGQGTGIDDQKMELVEYFRSVDKGLRDVLRGEQGPLVIAGVGYYLPLYAEANTYPYLVGEPLEGNWEEASDEDVQRKAWKVAEPLIEKRRTRDVNRYLNLVGSERATNDLRNGLQAACFGRVDTLFVPVGVQHWGSCDRQTGLIMLHEEERAGDVDLLNEAAILTLLRGGNVYAVRPDQMPDNDGASLNAILRW